MTVCNTYILTRDVLSREEFIFVVEFISYPVNKTPDWNDSGHFEDLRHSACTEIE